MKAQSLIDLAQQEAALSLACIARDLVLTNGLTSTSHSIGIHVRDMNGPVIKAHFVFESRRADH
jgi:hypothetical protein